MENRVFICKLSFTKLWSFSSFFKTIFFLSFIRGSLVKNPADFRVGLYSLLASFNALAIPWRIAPAWPVNPPPITLQITSYLSNVLVATNGCFTITFNTSVPKYSSKVLSFTVMFPLPSTSLTLAIDFFFFLFLGIQFYQIFSHFILPPKLQVFERYFYARYQHILLIFSHLSTKSCMRKHTFNSMCHHFSGLFASKFLAVVSFIPPIYPEWLL